MFRGSAGTLLCCKVSALGTEDRPPVWNGSACKGLAANGSVTAIESQ